MVDVIVSKTGIRNKKFKTILKYKDLARKMFPTHSNKIKSGFKRKECLFLTVRNNTQVACRIAVWKYKRNNNNSLFKKEKLFK